MHCSCLCFSESTSGQRVFQERNNDPAWDADEIHWASTACFSWRPSKINAIPQWNMCLKTIFGWLRLGITHNMGVELWSFFKQMIPISSPTNPVPVVVRVFYIWPQSPGFFRQKPIRKFANLEQIKVKNYKWPKIYLGKYGRLSWYRWFLDAPKFATKIEQNSRFPHMERESWRDSSIISRPSPSL